LRRLRQGPVAGSPAIHGRLTSGCAENRGEESAYRQTREDLGVMLQYHRQRSCSRHRWL